MRGKTLRPVAERRQAAGVRIEILLPEIFFPGAGPQQHQRAVWGFERTGAQTVPPGGGTALWPGRAGTKGHKSVPRLFRHYQRQPEQL